MVKKELRWHGKTPEEVSMMTLDQFAIFVTARERRKLKRGFTEQEKKLLKEVAKGRNNLETHCRDMMIVPAMVGKTIKIYNGKEFTPLTIDIEMLGHRLGEFAQTRRNVQHSAPGIGATRSSAAISVK